MAKGYLYDNGDELITREDVNEVPDSSTAHAGDILELDSNKKPKWSTPESELPSTGSASAGDVLSLDEDKEPVWSAPSVGGGIVVVGFDPTSTPVTIENYIGHNFYHAFILGTDENVTWNTLKELFDSGTPVLFRTTVSITEDGFTSDNYEYYPLRLTDMIGDSNEYRADNTYSQDETDPDEDLYMTDENVL